MHALVTGSAGFVGRNMVRELESRGYAVSGVDWRAYELEDTARHQTITTSGGGPISDALRFFRYEHKVYDLVVHCAYHVGGRAAIDGTNTHFMKNLQLDGAMFEWAVRTKQKRVLYFSSSSFYSVDCQEQGTTHRLAEDCCIPCLEPGMPDVNYGWAKLTGERLAQDARDNGVPVTVVRPFSGYGADQSLDYPFPSIVRRASEGDLTVWGPPGQCRDWIHISDVVRGALAVVDSGTADPVNLCTGIATEMGDLSRMIYRQSMKRISPDWAAPESHWAEKVEYLTDKPTGVFYRVGDPTRMLNYYTPQISLEQGISEALSAL